MSSNLAIAAVSAVMRYLLLNPRSSDSIVAVVPDLTVTAVAPQQVDDDAPHLNLFFYRAMANSGWVNRDLPSRSSAGARTSNPYLALDLYYLISAHGQRDYHGEILLGYAMQAFHENPVMPRDLIRTALTSPSLVTTDTPANVLAAFAAADLAEQIEQVKIAPHYPTADEVGNIWSPMQGGYVPSAYYKVSLVLIESRRPAQAAPPVRAFNLYALPFNQPRINEVVADAGVGQPILPGDRVLIRGSALRADDTRVRVGGVELSGNALEVSREQITLTLPSGLPAGITGVQVAHMLSIGSPPQPHRGVESNVVAFVLQPQIRPDGGGHMIEVVAAGGGQPRRLRVTLDPAVGPTQRAMILLNERSAPTTRPAHAFSIEAQPRANGSPPTNELTFPIPDVPAASYLVRVRVDGADSPLDYQAPDGFVAPEVVIP